VPFNTNMFAGIPTYKVRDNRSFNYKTVIVLSTSNYKLLADSFGKL